MQKVINVIHILTWVTGVETPCQLSLLFAKNQKCVATICMAPQNWRIEQKNDFCCNIWMGQN